MPETVKYGISNLTLIGILTGASSARPIFSLARAKHGKKENREEGGRTSLDGGKTEVGAHEEVLASRKLLDLPDEGRLLGRVVHGAHRGLVTPFAIVSWLLSEKDAGRRKGGPTRNLGESASSGTGTMISTLLAVDRRLNWARTLTTYSIREPRWFSTDADVVHRH